MHTPSQRDVRYQELIVPEQSGHSQHAQLNPHASNVTSNVDGCPVQQSPVQPVAPSHFQPHIIYPSVPTYHNDRSTNAGRRNKWQVRPKYANRQPQQTGSQSSNGYQVQTVPFKNSVTTNILMPLNETTSTPPMSTHTFILPPPGFSLRSPHAQQNNGISPLIQNNTKLPMTYCIVDSRTINPCQTQPTASLFPVQSATNNQQPTFNYSNMNFPPGIVNDSQHPSHRYCYQQARQYSPHKFHQIGPPPGFNKAYLSPQMVSLGSQTTSRDRENNPSSTHPCESISEEDRNQMSQSIKDDVIKLEVNTRFHGHHTYGNLHHFSPFTRHPTICDNDSCTINSHKVSSGVNKSTSTSKNVNVNSSIPSTSTQSIQSITGSYIRNRSTEHVSSKGSNSLRNHANKSLQHSLSRNITETDPKDDIEEDDILKKKEVLTSEAQLDKNNDLLSESSTSFDYTIEPEKMVSAICGTTPVNELEEATEHHTHSPGDNSDSDNTEHLSAPKTYKPLSRYFPDKSNRCGESEYCDNYKPTSVDATKDIRNIMPFHSENSVNNTAGLTNNMSYSQSNTISTQIKFSAEPRMKDLCTLAEKLCSKQMSPGDVCEQESRETGQSNVSCQADLQDRSFISISFHETLVRHCRELAEMLQTLPPSPHLTYIADFCTIIIQSNNEHTCGDAYGGYLKNAMRKLMLEFLHIALSWIHLNFTGILSIVELLNPDLFERFHIWKAKSNIFLKFMLKGLLLLINLCVAERVDHWHSSHSPENSQARPTQDLDDGNQDTDNACPRSRTSSATAPEMLPNNVSPSGPTLNTVQRRNKTIMSSDPTKFYALNTPRNAKHWRQRRFSDISVEKVAFQGTNKPNGYVLKPVDMSMKIFNSSMQPNNSSCSNHCTKIFPTDITSSPKLVRSVHQSGVERYAHHNSTTCNRERQKLTPNGDKTSSPKSINTESITFQNKPVEKDNVFSQWQIHKRTSTNEFQVLNTVPTDTVSRSNSEQWFPDAIRNKIIPVSQIEKMCPTEIHHLMDKIPEYHCCGNPSASMEPIQALTAHKYPEIRSHTASVNNRSFSQQVPQSDSKLCQQSSHATTEKSDFNIQHKTSRCRFSYQNSRNQMASKKRVHMSQGKSSVASNMMYLQQDDDLGSSDDSLDRVYMKPGSYDVPKKHFSPRNPGSFLLNGARLEPACDVPSPFNIPSSRKQTERSLWSSQTREILQSLESHDNLSSESTLSAPDMSSILPGTEQTEAQVKEEHMISDDSSENDNITDTMKIINTVNEAVVETTEEVVNGETIVREKDRGSGDSPEDVESNPSPTTGKRKCNAEKTDHWLMRILGVQVDGERESKTENEEHNTPPNSSLETDESPPESTDIDIEDKESVLNKPTPQVQGTESIDKNTCPSSMNGVIKPNANGMKIADNVALQDSCKTGDAHEVSKNRKLPGGKGKKSNRMYQVMCRSSSAPRKRKLHERSSNHEVETSSAGDTSCVLPNDGKSKEDIRNKGIWSVWYSSRRRRGLSQLAVGKLEEILNTIWNMNEAEFIKYPINSNAVSDYHQIVKHPMFLQTIAYKLRTRIYETIEQFVHDFRRVFYNSRLYNADTSIYFKMTNALAEKFDFLLEDIFSGWDFSHICGNPSEAAAIPSLQYRPYTNRGYTKRRSKLSSKAISSRSSTPAATNKDATPVVSGSQ